MEELPSTPGNKRSIPNREYVPNWDKVSNRESVPNRDTEEPGAVYNCAELHSPTFATFLQELQVHNKAIRTLASKHEGTSEGIYQACAIVSLYCRLHGKERQHRDKVVDWSGARNNWKRMIHAYIDKAINLGFIELTKTKTIGLSTKGKQVEEDYQNIFLDCFDTYETNGAKAREAGTDYQQQKRRIARRAAELARQQEEGTYKQAEPRNYSH